MPTEPRFEDLFDSADYFEWGTLQPLDGLPSPRLELDEMQLENAASNVYGAIVAVSPEGTRHLWTLAFDCDADENRQFKDFHAKGVFKFYTGSGSFFSVKWESAQFGERLLDGGRFLVQMTLREVG